MTRGGARAGAGRKGSLSKEQALMVGGECDRLWNKAAEHQAVASHKREPTGRMIRDEQERTKLIPKFARRHADLSDITESIDELTGGKRTVSIPLKRPYGAKGKVIADAIKWCEQEYGQIITTSKAIECWKEYKRFVKWAENQGSLNST